MSHKKPNTKELETIKDPKAAVLDYKQLKITIQLHTSKHLPTANQVQKTFIKYGNCTVENIGKSNQYLIKYQTPNSGFQALFKLKSLNTNGTIPINNEWCISSIKYQWNSYCRSMFSRSGICPGGSKCTFIHQIVQNDQAFIPVGKKSIDNLSYERLKQLRWKHHRENDSVENIEDWNNMEGMNINNNNNNNSSKNKNKNKKEEYANESDTSTDSSDISSDNDNNNSSSHKMNHIKLAQRKAKAAKLLQNQIKNGNANKKLDDAVIKNKNKNKKRQRQSPPIKPIESIINENEIDNKSVISNVSNKSEHSNISYRSARSTVYINKPNININDSSDSDSDSSSSSCFNNNNNNNNKGNDWNKLNNINNNIKNKRKNDAISMRYLKNKNNENNNSNVVRSKRKNGRNNNNNIKNKVQLKIPKDIIDNKNKVRGSVCGKSNRNNNHNNNDINEMDSVSVTSTERIALKSVSKVLGSNDINLSRVPIIDPNKHTVKYIKNKTRKPPPPHPSSHPNTQSPQPIPSPISQRVSQQLSKQQMSKQSQPNYNRNRNRNFIISGPMNSMPNRGIINPINNINPMNIVNAPPYYPSGVNNVFNPAASVPNIYSMPIVPIAPISGTGNILAGTFKASIPNTHSQPQPFISPLYNNSNSPIIQPNNNNSNSPIMQPNNNNNNNCANNIPSIPTTSVNRNKNLKPKPKPVSNSKPKPKIENLEDPKFIFTYDTNREAPSTNEDFHWLCYHFRSGERHSCTFGRQCKWRHYDFDLRSDIITVWNPIHINPHDKPNITQLAEARILKKDLERRYKWLKDKKYSNNIFINNNNTPPDCKKERIKKKLFVDENDKDEKIKNNNNNNNVENDHKDEDDQNDNDNDNNNEEKTVEDSIKDNILKDLNTALSIMDPFSKEKSNRDIDYHVIGRLALMQLIAFKKKLNEEL